MPKKRTLHIRFVDHSYNTPQITSDGAVVYGMQRKTILGWQTFNRAIGGSPAGVGYGPYTSDSKDKLLIWILGDNYNTSMKHVNIIEHAPIKVY